MINRITKILFQELTNESFYLLEELHPNENHRKVICNPSNELINNEKLNFFCPLQSWKFVPRLS